MRHKGLTALVIKFGLMLSTYTPGDHLTNLTSCTMAPSKSQRKLETHHTA
jgi:hypothetical protein